LSSNELDHERKRYRGNRTLKKGKTRARVKLLVDQKFDQIRRTSCLIKQGKNTQIAYCKGSFL